jgi:hypothetical protein
VQVGRPDHQQPEAVGEARAGDAVGRSSNFEGLDHLGRGGVNLQNINVDERWTKHAFGIVVNVRWVQGVEGAATV